MTPPPSTPPTSHRLALNALLAGAAGIAFAPILVRLSQVGPSATAFWRLLLALPFLWPWLLRDQSTSTASSRPASFADYRSLALAGLFFAGDLGIWHWSIKFTSVANATLLVNAAPIFVALGGWLFFKQRVGWGFVLSLGLALLGMAGLVGGAFNPQPQQLLGDFLGLLAAVFYAGYILWVQRLRQHFSTATVMVWSSLATMLILLPAAFLAGEKFLPLDLAGWGVLLALALISQVGGQTLIAFALARLPAAFSSVTLLLQPVLAALFAWLLLHETLAPLQMLGGGLTLLGIFLARRASAGS